MVKKSKKKLSAAEKFLSLNEEQRQDAVMDYVKNIDKYDPKFSSSMKKFSEYEKKYGTGFNFDIDFHHNEKIDILSKEKFRNKTSENIYGLFKYHLLHEEIVKCIEKKSIIHRYTDEDLKVWEGKVKFVNREPSEKEKKEMALRAEKYEKEREEQMKKDKPFAIATGLVIFGAIIYYFFIK